jgi:hypothetical protein
VKGSTVMAINSTNQTITSHIKKVLTVMAINSTNINKIKNHLSPRERLNSDGHPFQPYQENEQSHLNFTH